MITSRRQILAALGLALPAAVTAGVPALAATETKKPVHHVTHKHVAQTHHTTHKHVAQTHHTTHRHVAQKKPVHHVAPKNKPA